jgi:RimJ/RimL family protein N-acetyltransferase
VTTDRRPPVRVRSARAGDETAVERIARASWAETYRDIFDPAFIADFLDRNYAHDALAAAIAGPGEFLVAERDGAPVAFAQYASGRRGPELFRIYADPDHYATGAGAALLDELHRRIGDEVDGYVLDVHSGNARGRAFYDRHGFVIVGGGATPCCDLTLRKVLHPRRAHLPRETERLRLRRLADDDDEALHRIYGDAETMRFIGRSGRPTPELEATRRGLQSLRRHDELHGFGMWAVDEREGDPLVAIAGLLWVEGHGPEVEAAYLVRRDRWGRGYASEALREVLRIGHDELGLERIVALAWPANDASRRVMERAGMRPGGTTTAYARELTRHVSEGA